MKKKTAVVWKQNGGYGITLHMPVLMMNMEKGTAKGKFEKVKDVDLPRPMTSNQFNTFINTTEGEDWAKKELKKVM